MRDLPALFSDSRAHCVGDAGGQTVTGVACVRHLKSLDERVSRQMVARECVCVCVQVVRVICVCICGFWGSVEEYVLKAGGGT